MHRRKFLVTLSGLVLEPALTRAAEDAAFLRGTLTKFTLPGGGDNRATYMPDGKAVLFASARTGRSQIWAVDADGGIARQVHESGANDYGRVAPSPDGTRVCFSSNRGGQNAIYVLDLGTGAATLISDLAWWSFGPTWSSRGLIAYFSRKGGNAINILRGLGPLPSIAGRSPSYMFRQLYDFRHGARTGEWSPLMVQAVATLDEQDLLAIVAYLASRDP
jgi:WD40-like Beta Propeller Repeat